MDLTARDIHEKQFHDAWRGYNQEEVDDFLDKVAEVIEALRRESSALQERVTELDLAIASGKGGDEALQKALASARKAAEDALAQAKVKAGHVMTEAETEARRRAIDAERNFAARAREIEASIDVLRAFEKDLKQRLSLFLEQQRHALEMLSEKEGPKVRIPTPPAGGEARPGAAERAPTTPSRARREDAVVNLQADQPVGGGGGLRGMFGRREERR